METRKIENMLIGGAVGDAFGLGIEFQDRDWIRQNVDFTKFVNKREGKYIEGYKNGYYSDDTEHTIGLIEALTDGRPFSKELLLEMWKREYETDKKNKGFPRQGHGTIKDWYEGKKTIEEIKANQFIIQDPGCGPTMRAVPLGLINSELIDSYAIINADASNGHPKAEASSIIVARTSEYMIVKEGNPLDIFNYCKKFVSDKETLNYLSSIEKLPKPDNLKESDYEKLCGPQPIPTFKQREVRGVPNSAMRVAGATLYIIKYSNDAFSGLRNAIYLGGDVDSVASISTAILGGRYGLNSIPKFMTEQVEGKERLEQLSLKFAEHLNNLKRTKKLKST